MSERQYGSLMDRAREVCCRDNAEDMNTLLTKKQALLNTSRQVQDVLRCVQQSLLLGQQSVHVLSIVSAANLPRPVHPCTAIPALSIPALPASKQSGNAYPGAHQLSLTLDRDH